MNQFKKEALKLRRAGYSYTMIREKLGVSKSTLSNWLINIPFRPNREVIKKIGQAKLKSALYKQNMKFEDMARMKKEAAEEVGKLSKRDIFMLGIGLYIGEGSKAIEEIRIVNSDPIIIKLAIKWLKKFCKLEKKHFKIAIHGYPDHNINKLIAFWSKETDLLIEQFGKTIIDTRKNKSLFKKRKLPYGTAHLYVKSCGTLSPGIRSLHRKIMGWIKVSVSQI
ncbi:hypothetical protein COS33_01195 [Candidatus Wolfebacteria bacterium CG02_land_8_20_14_3_00_37_12]|uniref:Uncharacterized protein n=3 Tax=Candidatus Wolfeibacteriota TaxID=1752735 RepID=A0A2M7Q8B5_9BACT|nr:MAG: hypothetical protein COS33_01195 [Candidatus Wolfebacteria bacterium CG02_land_8_20_14_3_00_37_12]PIY59623.1 MAG: hypothetical protein COY96_00800 [Candidatus Wolfebacteria bacterium CG_4_10_14_0_8_um_filter_37_11]